MNPSGYTIHAQTLLKIHIETIVSDENLPRCELQNSAKLQTISEQRTASEPDGIVNTRALNPRARISDPLRDSSAVCSERRWSPKPVWA